MSDRSNTSVFEYKESAAADSGRVVSRLSQLTVATVCEQAIYPSGVEVKTASDRLGRYSIWRFTEESYPEGAIVAQQIQGESYRHANYVLATGLDSDGRLLPDLDRSRGSNVVYYLASLPDQDGNLEPQSSLRKVSIPYGGTIEDLAAYRYSKGALFDGENEKLLNTIRDYGTDAVVEIAALSKTNNAPGSSSLELIRSIFTESIEDGSPRKWIITLTESVYGFMVEVFGDKAVRQIGDKIEVDIGDVRTSPELRLMPVVIEPQECLVSIASSAEEKASQGDLLGAKRLIFGYNFIKADLDQATVDELINTGALGAGETTR